MLRCLTRTRSFNDVRSIFIVLSLTLVLPATLLAQDFAGGDGSEANPYQIETWDHLNNIRNHLDSHFILNNHLTPETAGYATHVKDDATLADGGQGWDPIGGCNATDEGIVCIHFSGVLDGNHHAIEGLEINRSQQAFTGLFGLTGQDAVIKNVDLIQLEVVGWEYASGLVGKNAGALTNISVSGNVSGILGDTGGVAGSNEGSISGASFYGIVQGEGSTGGLVGANWGGNVEASWARAQVTGQAFTGGAIGQNQGSASRLFSTGSVTGLTDVGGLVGLTTKDINQSYSQASVTATNGVAGGLIGSIGASSAEIVISESYATGTVIGNDDSRGLVGNAPRNQNAAAFVIAESYWDVDASNIGSVGTDDVGAIGVTTANMKKQLTFVDWDFSTEWLIEENQTYPTLKAMAFAGGAGTAADPYQIEHWDHLANIPYAMSGEFVLTRDLGRFSEGYAHFVKDGETLADGGQGWLPIGNTNSEFEGVFDGDNHSIHGLAIDRDNLFVGLFGGVIGEAVITNLNLLDIDIDGSFITGGLVGDASDRLGTISNVRVTGQITAADDRIGCLAGQNFGAVINAHVDCTITVTDGTDVGGLIGYNRGPVDRSSSLGSVTGQDRVGGLIGNNGGPIDESFSHADVTGRAYVGGLIGIHSQEPITNAYATGQVVGAESTTVTTSGLIGSNGEFVGAIAIGGDVINSYSAGPVTGGWINHALIAQSVAPSVLYHANFFDSEVTGQTEAFRESATALTSAQMKTQASFTEAGWNFSADGIWEMETCVYASYPYLRTIAYDSPGQTPAILPIPGLVESFGAPTSVSASASDTQATVSWDPPAGCEDSSAITGYVVTASPGGASCTTTGETLCTITGLTNGTEYAFSVVALSGDSVTSATALAGTVVTPSSIPAAPTDLIAIPGFQKAVIDFNPADNGGSPITNYAYSLNDGLDWVALSPPDVTTPVTITGLDNDTEYSVRLRAINIDGPGASSAPVLVCPSDVIFRDRFRERAESSTICPEALTVQ